MNAGIVKRSLAIAGHRTSISLEEPFWVALREIATARGAQNLSSAIRVFVLDAVRTASEPSLPDGSGSAAEA